MLNMQNPGTGILELMQRIEKLEKRTFVELINFSISINEEIKISERWEPFTQLLFMQGTTGDAYGIHALSGYGSGTSVRYHIGDILKSENVTIKINDTECAQEFIVRNQSISTLSCTLMIIQGNIPTIIQEE